MQSIVVPRAGPIIARTIGNPILKDEIIFLEISRESGGRHTLIDVLLAVGGHNSMHYHNDIAEEFTCLQGELSVQIGRQVFRLRPGESIVAPARSKHRFFNQSGQSCRFQCRFTPGFPGIEQFLQIAYGLARDGKVTARGIPKNLYVLGYLILISGTSFTGIMTLMQPLLNWLGRQAVRRGIAAELQRRYMTVW